MIGHFFSPSNSSVIVREYTSSDLWVKPSDLKMLLVICAGAGGGGGGGSLRNAQCSGGGGGGGGSVLCRFFLASELSPTHSVSVGVGGSGGVPTGAFGAAGSNGTSTIFSDLIANGGRGGSAGIAGAVSALGGIGGTASDERWSYSGAGGGASLHSSNGSPGVNGWINSRFAPGGGGGGGSNANQRTGGAGGGIYFWDGSNWSLQAGATAGAVSADGSNGDDNILVNFFLKFTTTHGIGTGGGGGGSSQTAGSSGKGGNGGRCAGGGGGGSSAAASLTGGPGGKGGDGLCIIVEIF